VPLVTDLHVLFAGLPLFRGRVGIGGNCSDVISATSGHHATFPALSYRGILERRIFYGNTDRVFTNMDMAPLVMAILGMTQTQQGGGLGITGGIGFPMLGHIVPTQTVTSGDVIGQLIDELAYQKDIGFDWDITPQDQSLQTIDLWLGSRGTDRGVVLQFGDGLTTGEWTRDLDTSVYANALHMSGSAPAPTKAVPSPVPPTPVEVVVSDIATRPEGRWDAVLTSEELDESHLAAYAELTLAADAIATPSYTIPLKPGAWGGPSHIWIGDIVHVVLQSGRFQGTRERLRVLEISANVGQDLVQVVLTLGAPRLDVHRQLRRLARELRKARKHRHAGRDPRPIYQITGPSSGLSQNFGEGI
jgi:hypothetical protein